MGRSHTRLNETVYQETSELLELLRTELSGRQRFNGEKCYPHETPTIRSCIRGLYLHTLEGAHKVDKADTSDQRLIEQTFYTAVTELGQVGFAPKRIKWCVQGSRTDNHDESKNYLERLNKVKSADIASAFSEGRRESFLSKIHKGVEWQTRGITHFVKDEDTHCNPLIAMMLAFQRQVKIICPVQQRERRIHAELDKRQYQFDHEHTLGIFLKIPALPKPD